MSMSDLGYYEKSYRLMMLPLQNITQVITPVMHPIFSDFQNDRKSWQHPTNALSVFCHSSVCHSAYCFLYGGRGNTDIFGDQWLPSVPVFPDTFTFSRYSDHTLLFRLYFFRQQVIQGAFLSADSFRPYLNVTGMLTGIFYFGTLTAVAICIVITFTINFVQCYWMMYRVTFQRNAWIFIRQLLSPLLVSLLITAFLTPIYYMMENMNIFVTLIAKSFVSFIIFGTYMQVTHTYDITGKVKTLVRNRKLVQKNKQ